MVLMIISTVLFHILWHSKKSFLCRTHFARHILYLAVQCHPKTTIHLLPMYGRRKKGRLLKMPFATFKEDFPSVGNQWDDAETAATNCIYIYVCVCVCVCRKFYLT